MDLQKLYNDADAAGRAAVEKLEVQPMIVTDGQKQYYVPDGVCGFAWINIRPGNSKFANFLKKQGLARSSYYGGVDVWVSQYNQSMRKKEAYAAAFASVLCENGINAYSSSRMD